MDVQEPLSESHQQLAAHRAVTVRPLLLKPQWMNGLSERLLVSHYVNNYGGTVRQLNTIRARLATLDWARTPAFEINGLKREELIAAGSVILHEVYFESLGGQGDNPPTGLEEPPAALARANTELAELGRDAPRLLGKIRVREVALTVDDGNRFGGCVGRSEQQVMQEGGCAHKPIRRAIKSRWISDVPE